MNISRFNISIKSFGRLFLSLSIVMLPILGTGCAGGGMEGTNTDSGATKEFIGQVFEKDGISPVARAEITIERNSVVTASGQTGADGMYLLNTKIVEGDNVALGITSSDGKSSARADLGIFSGNIKTTQVDFQQKGNSFDVTKIVITLEDGSSQGNDPIVPGNGGGQSSPTPTPTVQPTATPTPTPDPNFGGNSIETPTPSPTPSPSPTPEDDNTSDDIPPPGSGTCTMNDDGTLTCVDFTTDTGSGGGDEPSDNTDDNDPPVNDTI